MDNAFLILLGLACLIAALVGGGLNAFGVEIPVLKSVARQIGLGLLGLILIVIHVTINPLEPPPLELPTVVFEYPTSNATIALKTELRGILTPPKLDGGSSWIIIRDDDGDYYPQAEIAATPNGSWTHPLTLGPKWRGRPVYVLVAFSRDEKVNEVLRRSVRGEGFSELPNNVHTLAILNLRAHP